MPMVQSKGEDQPTICAHLDRIVYSVQLLLHISYHHFQRFNTNFEI